MGSRRFIGIVAAVSLLGGGVQATYKPEFSTHSDALRQWFQNAETTPEYRAWRESRSMSAFVSCCESSERVRAKFRMNKTDRGDDWYYECPEELKEACGGIVGNWKQIPPMIIHHEPIEVPSPYDKNDPRIKAEFDQLRAEGVLFVAYNAYETCFWPPQSGQ